MKAAWIAAFGPNSLLESATARLEIIADTFLSMNAPVQHAMPYLLANRSNIQQQVLAAGTGKYGGVGRLIAGASAISRLEVQGGWYVVLRVPALMSGDTLADSSYGCRSVSSCIPAISMASTAMDGSC